MSRKADMTGGRKGGGEMVDGEKSEEGWWMGRSRSREGGGTE